MMIQGQKDSTRELIEYQNQLNKANTDLILKALGENTRAFTMLSAEMRSIRQETEQTREEIGLVRLEVGEAKQEMVSMASRLEALEKGATPIPRGDSPALQTNSPISQPASPENQVAQQTRALPEKKQKQTQRLEPPASQVLEDRKRQVTQEWLGMQSSNYQNALQGNDKDKGCKKCGHPMELHETLRWSELGLGGKA